VVGWAAPGVGDGAVVGEGEGEGGGAVVGEGAGVVAGAVVPGRDGAVGAPVAGCCAVDTAGAVTIRAAPTMPIHDHRFIAGLSSRPDR